MDNPGYFTTSEGTLLHLAGLLPLVAGLVCWLTLTLLLLRQASLPMDRPSARSLHTQPTPRIGGLGIMAGVALSDFLAHLGVVLVPAVLALALFMLSLLDDLRGLPVWLRLLGHGVVAAVALHFLPGVSGWAWWVAWLALVWMTNLYNFMDGADGLAGGMAVLGFAGYGVAAWLGGSGSLAILAWSIAAAAAGFLPFNFPPARVFMGDAGSIPLGFLAASLGLGGWSAGIWPLTFPLLVFSPFIADASVTLLKRAWRGERIWLAHREHYYQRLVRMGWSHRRVVLAEYAVMVLAGVSGLGLVLHPERQAALLMAWAGIYLALAVVIDRRWKESGLAD